tara:strand:+ start:165 stop:797 length:633 start_codon:yes stop_codon:yes gene_type:complete
MTSITKLTEKYIDSHPSIKDCLKKDLINYSKLSRLIAEDFDEKNINFEAILIASRRFQEKLKKSPILEDKIISFLKNSELDIKNKVVVTIIDKLVYPGSLIDFEKEIKKNKDIFFSIEGTGGIILITSEKYLPKLKKLFKSSIIKIRQNLVMIIIKCSKELENTPGISAFLYSKFGENGVNIVETMSCWTDNIFIIDEKDLTRTMEFLKF